MGSFGEEENRTFNGVLPVGTKADREEVALTQWATDRIICNVSLKGVITSKVIGDLSKFAIVVQELHEGKCG